MACLHPLSSLFLLFLSTCLFERGAKRQVLASGHFVPSQMLDQDPSLSPSTAWKVGEWEVSRHASESFTELSSIGIVCFTLTCQPLAFWWQVPCAQGYSSRELSASASIEGDLCSRWMVPVAY